MFAKGCKKCANPRAHSDEINGLQVCAKFVHCDMSIRNKTAKNSNIGLYRPSTNMKFKFYFTTLHVLIECVCCFHNLPTKFAFCLKSLRKTVLLKEYGPFVRILKIDVVLKENCSFESILFFWKNIVLMKDYCSFERLLLFWKITFIWWNSVLLKDFRSYETLLFLWKMFLWKITYCYFKIFCYQSERLSFLFFITLTITDFTK